jgi:DNA-binding GntR family transcriptional regulator
MSKSVDKAYAAIRDAIVEQRFQPGERLTEERLAEEIGVSRTPVREALRRLSADGFLELLPNQGARLPAWSVEDVREIFGLRLALEGFGAEAAASRITPDQVAELRRLCDAMERLAAGRKPGFIDEIANHNRRFHRILVEAAGGTRFARILAQVIEVPIVLKTYHRYSVADMDRSMAHHRELTQALAARDATWAGAVMRAHIQAGRAAYLTGLEAGDEPLGVAAANGHDAGAAAAAPKVLRRAVKRRG